MIGFKMGDKVIYKGEEWEVGFVNQINFKGTLRLQKSGLCDAEQVNRVYPEDVVKINKEVRDGTHKGMY